MSAAEKDARLQRLEQVAEEAVSLAQAGDIAASSQSIAMTMATLLGVSIEDERKDYERARSREKAFAKELLGLATGHGSTLEPAERTRRLTVLAQWIDEGWEGPPTEQDYAVQPRWTGGRS